MRKATSRGANKIPTARNVDAYINKAPKATRAKLLQLRRIIKAAAPKANEGVSYQIPYYWYNGRLAYFAAFKNHVSLFIPTPVLEEHKRELKNFKTTKATIHFPLDQTLPVALIRKLIKARLAINRGKDTRNKARN